MLDKISWDSLWEKSRGSAYQSSDWSKIKENSGSKPIFITLEKNNKLTAGILAFEQSIKTPLGTKKILFSEGNPLFLNNEDGIKILEKYKEISKKYFYGLIQPRVTDFNAEIFSKAHFKRVNNSTILINLKKTKEELWSGLEKKSARWGVKTAEKNNLEIAEASAEDIDNFFEIYKKTAELGKFNPKPIEFFHEILSRKDLFRILIVRHQGKIIAGGVIILDKDYNILSVTASNEHGQKMQAMPLLYWKFILLSKEQNKNCFDLGGYDKFSRKGEKIYNINKFKENFGGSIVNQPIYSTNFKYSQIRKLMRRFKFIKSFYKK